VVRAFAGKTFPAAGCTSVPIANRRSGDETPEPLGRSGTDPASLPPVSTPDKLRAAVTVW